MGMTVYSQDANTLPKNPKVEKVDVKKVDMSDKSPVEKKLFDIMNGSANVEDLAQFVTVEEAPLGSKELGDAIKAYINGRSDTAKSTILEIIEDSESENPLKDADNSQSFIKNDKSTMMDSDKKILADRQFTNMSFSNTLTEIYDSEDNDLFSSEEFSNKVSELRKLTYPDLKKELEEVKFQFSDEVKNGVTKLVNGKITVDEFSELFEDEVYYPHKSHMDLSYPKQILIDMFSGESDKNKISLVRKYTETKSTGDILTLDDQIMDKFSNLSFSDVFEIYSDSEDADDLQRIYTKFKDQDDTEELELAEGLVYSDKKDKTVNKVNKITDKDIRMSIYPNMKEYITNGTEKEVIKEFSELEDYFSDKNSEYIIVKEPLRTYHIGDLVKIYSKYNRAPYRKDWMSQVKNSVDKDKAAEYILEKFPDIHEKLNKYFDNRKKKGLEVDFAKEEKFAGKIKKVPTKDLKTGNKLRLQGKAVAKIISVKNGKQRDTKEVTYEIIKEDKELGIKKGEKKIVQWGNEANHYVEFSTISPIEDFTKTVFDDAIEGKDEEYRETLDNLKEDVENIKSNYSEHASTDNYIKNWLKENTKRIKIYDILPDDYNGRSIVFKEEFLIIPSDPQKSTDFKYLVEHVGDILPMKLTQPKPGMCGFFYPRENIYINCYEDSDNKWGQFDVSDYKSTTSLYYFKDDKATQEFWGMIQNQPTEDKDESIKDDEPNPYGEVENEPKEEETPYKDISNNPYARD